MHTVGLIICVIFGVSKALLTFPSSLLLLPSLQDWGADVMSTFLGLHASHFACMYSWQALAEFYFLECRVPVDLTLPPDMGFTPLHAVAGNSNADEPTAVLPMVKWLVETKGASVTLKDVSGHPPSHMASVAGNRKVCEYLQRREKMEVEAQQKKKEELEKQTGLAQRERLAAEATEAFLAELELEEKEEQEKKKEKKKAKKAMKKKA